MQICLPVKLRRSQEAHLRLGDEEHQQPQRQHPQEVLPGSIGMSHLYRPPPPKKKLKGLILQEETPENTCLVEFKSYFICTQFYPQNGIRFYY